jgi:8-oxo-dGTP pyrophosphatase MutT (NUDIX family)
MTDEESPELVIGRRVHVEQCLVPRRDGKQELRERVLHPGSVVLLPVLADGRLVLIRQRRFAVERTLLELPAGTREADEPIELCAARELEEETGYRARELTPLFSFFPSPGSSTERMHVFVARGLVQTAQQLDQTEEIEVEVLAMDEVLALIRSNDVEDAKTIAAVLFFRTWAHAAEESPLGAR